MMLELIGGRMNAEPDWALSVAELESLGLATSEAKSVVGLPPGFVLGGRWVMLIDDEPYDAKTARVIEIGGDEARCSRGPRGTVSRLRKKALIRFPAKSAGGDDECIAVRSVQAGDFLMGTVYYGRDLPEGDPSRLWDDAEAEDRLDELPIAMPVWLYREDSMEAL
jgi:hypothetical protein